jgi:hypothetical protein
MSGARNRVSTRTIAYLFFGTWLLGCRPAPSDAVEQPETNPNSDCLQTFVLGTSETAVTAPAFVDDAVFVASLRENEGQAELVVRRVTLQGEVTEAIVLTSAGFGSPQLASHGANLVLTTVREGQPEAIVFAASGEQLATLPLPDWMESLDVGERGLVGLSGFFEDVDHQTVVRLSLDGSTASNARIPHRESALQPWEQLVATGSAVDLIVIREPESSGIGLFACVIPPDAKAPTSRHLLARESEEVVVGTSVAAGTNGFLVVVDETSSKRWALTVHLFDNQGTPIGAPVRHEAPDDGGVRRYARAVAHGEGWVVSFWDGIGVSLLDLDAAGRAMGLPKQLRTADERGGHTDGRMDSSGDVLAITWEVWGPEWSHGLASEQPEHPGPRLALVGCPSKIRRRI